MTSASPGQALVWAWLPGAAEPVVAGRLQALGEFVLFNYGRSYLAREDAVSLYEPELPLRPGCIRPSDGLAVAGCIKDAGPDAWGQRVILARHVKHLDRDSDTGDLGLLTYLLESGSDRNGALDFQASASTYVPRLGTASLAEMQTAAEQLQAGEELPPDLHMALLRGTSIDGCPSRRAIAGSARAGRATAGGGRSRRRGEQSHFGTTVRVWRTSRTRSIA